MKKGLKIFSILLAAGMFLLPLSSSAQNRRTRGGNAAGYGMRIEKKVLPPVSAAIARRDSLRLADSLRRADSVALLGKSSLDNPAFSNARDSMFSVRDPQTGSNKMYYYGEVKVTYQDMELTADYMEYDMKTRTVYARGSYDSTKMEWVGRPVMKQGGKEYKMEDVHYNFDTRKAFINNMITDDDEGILHGRNIKMMEDRSINITNGKYTVCDADHPHYYLALTAAKVVQEPSQKTIIGPSYLVVEDVKLPFVGLPFGFIPKKPERATGLLMPTFGEEQARGFYMRGLGMYFVFGDHLDLQVTGDYYTLGSWALNVSSRYNVKYKFNGGFQITYSNDQTGERGTPEFNQMTNFGISWNHSQDSKANPGSTFRASVDLKSPSNNRYNSTSLDQALQNQASSTISYSKNWNGKFSLSLNLRHSQNSRDSSYSFTLPNLTMSLTTIYPFKRKERVGKEKFYEKISFAYNSSLDNKIDFKASDFGKDGMMDKFKNGMTHNFTIGLPTFQILKYLSVSPKVTYGQKWVFRTTDYSYNEETGKVESSQSRQFSTLGIYQDYSFGASMSTRIYGTFNFKGGGKLQAIRHVISPSMSLNYTPDLGTRANGYRTLNYTDASGQEQTYKYNIYSGSLVSIPSSGNPIANASISIGNNLEAKVRDYADTTGTGTKKVKLIDQFNISTGYNFLAKSYKMSTVSMSMATSLFNKISINASASFDPYGLDEKGKRIDKFAISLGQGLLRMSSVNASASYSISGKGKVNGNDGSKTANVSSSISGAATYYKRNYYHPVTGEFIPEGWLYYTNPDVPWSLNMSASFSMSPSYSYNNEKEELVRKLNPRATMSCSGNIKLTPRLSVNMSSGFDFVAMKMTSTQFSANYDLHCFNIAVSWIPLGTYKSYSFTIAAKASTLADLLKFKKSDSYWDN